MIGQFEIVGYIQHEQGVAVCISDRRPNGEDAAL